MMKDSNNPKRGLHRRDLLKSAAAAGMGLTTGIIGAPLGVRKFTFMFADIGTPILRKSVFSADCGLIFLTESETCLVNGDITCVRARRAN